MAMVARAAQDAGDVVVGVAVVVHVFAYACEGNRLRPCPRRASACRGRRRCPPRLGVHHVLDHDAGRIVVGVGERHLDLAVECLLADGDRRRRLGGDRFRDMPKPRPSALPAGTTRLTRPYSAASRAGSISPSSSISMARLRDTLRDSATIGVEQNRPMLTPGVQKVARLRPRRQDRRWPRAGSRPPCAVP